jgi:Peptidase family M28
MNTRCHIRTAAVLVATGMAALGQAQDHGVGSAPGNGTILEQHLRDDLSYLASDTLQGRLTGTRGNELATEFIRDRFDRLGLKPMGESGSYFQPYTLVVATLGASNDLEIRGAGKNVRVRVGEDFYPQPFTATGRASGPLVFVGFGIAAPDIGYDDYRGADVRGRVVLALDHEPGELDPASPLDGLVSAEAATPLRKALAAQDRGASAILFVSDVHNHPGASGSPFSGEASMIWPRQRPRIDHYTLAAWVERVRIPALTISPALASVLLHDTGQSLAEIGRASESATGRAVRPIPNVSVDVLASLTRSETGDRNVLGAIEGSDPRLRDEWVIIGAHVDHDGADGTRIFSGADDNGSGTAGLLEIAGAYAEAARAGQRPRRSVLFGSWNSEERGLLGSWAYTEHPSVPLDRTVAVLNMDMIGRDEEVPANGGYRFQGVEPQQSAVSNENAVNLLGYSYAPDLSEDVEEANASFGLELKRRYDNTSASLLSRSDQWPFLQHGVPAIWFHTGLHPDYHTPGDRAEKINYQKLTRIVRLVHQTSWLIAQGDSRPKLAHPVD